MALAAARAERDSQQVRSLLVDAGLSNLVQIIEMRFDNYDFFAVAALNTTSGSGGCQETNRPAGVVAPLVWMCYQTNALGEIDQFDVAFINTHLYMIRALRGLEGGAAQVAIWGMLVGLLGMIISVLLSLPAFCALVGGGIVLLPLCILYVYLCWVMIYRRVFR
jgi:hypothetical protein